VLKRENRIRSKKEFAEIREKGRIKYSPLFGYLVANDESSDKKFAVIVSKKISKKAVDRNQIRRRITEVLNKEWNNIPEGTRGVFLTKKEILGKSLKDIEVEIVKIIKN